MPPVSTLLGPRKLCYGYVTRNGETFGLQGHPSREFCEGRTLQRPFRGSRRVTSVTKRNDSRNSSGSKLLWFINKKWSSKVLERSSCMRNEPRKIFFRHPVDRNRDKVGDTSRKMRVSRIVSSGSGGSRRDLAGNEDRTRMNETIKQ